MSDVRRAAYLLNLFLLLTAVATLSWRSAPSAAAAGRPPAPAVPARIGAWAAQGDETLPEGAREVLATATVINRSYAPEGSGNRAAEEAAPIGFTLIGGTDRSTLHDPRSCFVGAGWRIENDHVEPLPGGSDAPRVRACRVTRDASAADNGGGAGPEAYNVLYFYLVDGKVVSDVTRIRAEMLWSAMVGQRDRTVYFLRFVQPVSSGAPGSGAGDEDLRNFTRTMWQSVGPQLLRAEGTS